MKDSAVFMIVFLAFTVWSLVFTFHGEFLCSFASLILGAICWAIGIHLESESK